jgi:hypothetical protein
MAPLSKDEKIRILEEKLKIYEESPYVQTYMAMRKQFDSFNSQLSEKEINIFKNEDDDFFTRAWKFMEGSPGMLKNLDEIRKLMNPEQQKELVKAEEMKGLGTAEKIALKNLDK